MRIPKNLEKIDTNELGELLWWSAHLGAAPEKILSAINETGNLVTAVRDRLKFNPNKH